MIFLDTNIFLYAAGTPHPYREPCQEVLRSVAQRKLAATTSTEVLQEILHVLDRRSRRADALDVTRNALRLLPLILAVTSAEVARACEILERNPSLRVRDAFHAATMLSNGITQIMSVDPDFDRIPGIRRILPS